MKPLDFHRFNELGVTAPGIGRGIRVRAAGTDIAGLFQGLTKPALWCSLPAPKHAVSPRAMCFSINNSDRGRKFNNALGHRSGNTTVFAVFDDEGRIVGDWRSSSNAARTADEFGL